jgi:hypothetical protein
MGSFIDNLSSPPAATSLYPTANVGFCGINLGYLWDMLDMQAVLSQKTTQNFLIHSLLVSLVDSTTNGIKDCGTTDCGISAFVSPRRDH